MRAARPHPEPEPATSVGVILNPNAHGVRRDRRLADRLRAVVGDSGEVVATRNPEEVDRALERLLAAGCGLIATCGGDGTNLSTLTGLVSRLGEERLPRLAILRGGTVNTVANNLGIRGRPEALLARLVARLRGQQPLDTIGQDLIAVACPGGATPRMYGFLFAAAMGARFLEAYYAGPVPGVAWATALALRLVASSLVQGRWARWLFAPVNAELAVDGAPLGIFQARMLVASVVPDVGLGLRVAWRAGRVPGRLHLVASSMSTTSMALQVPRVLAGLPLRGAPHLDRLARDVVIRFPSPQAFTLDGDLFRAAEIHVRIGPRLRIVVP